MNDPEAQPKDKTVLLLITNSEHAVKVLEQVGGNELANLLLKKFKENPTNPELQKQNESLNDPVGTDVFVIIDKLLASSIGMLDITLDVENDVLASDNLKLIITH